MTKILIGFALLAVMGAAFGAILSFAAKAFAVEKDPREEEILKSLPGANCGGCGYPGCAGYAAAVASGKAPVNACAVGEGPVAAKLAEIMGSGSVSVTRKEAVVHCTGCGAEFSKYNYQGVKDCLAASRLPGGGPLGCEFGCLGMGTCEKVCPFDAIHVENGVAVVDADKCMACGKCVDACPRHIIALEPFRTKKHVSVPCSSKAKGAVVSQVCTNGCIGCGLCAKACPKDAITVEDNLARIDYDKCVGCGICASKCPRHLITVDAKPSTFQEVPQKETPKEEKKAEAPKEEKKVEAPQEEKKAEAPQEEKKAEAPKEEKPAEAPKEAPAAKEEDGKTSAEALKALEDAVAAVDEALKTDEPAAAEKE